MIRKLVSAGIFIVTMLTAQMPFREKVHPTPGEWAAQGVYLGYGLGALDRPGEFKVSRVPSPDKNTVAVFKARKLHLLRGDEELPGPDRVGFPHLSEALWSSDGAALAVTWSDGGNVGTWRPRVFTIKSERAAEVKVIDALLRDFAARFACEQPGDLIKQANVGAVHWIDGSSQILFVAEVPRHSSCRDMGKLMGYVVSIPSGQVTKRLSRGQLRSQWGQYLGARFGHPLTK